MKKQFESWYSALDENEKNEIINYILKDAESQTLLEKHFKKLWKEAPKGIFTGPVSSGEKCPHCGKLL